MNTLRGHQKFGGAMEEFAEVQYKSSENREMFRCHMCFSSKKKFMFLQPSTPDTPVQGFSAIPGSDI